MYTFYGMLSCSVLLDKRKRFLQVRVFSFLNFEIITSISLIKSNSLLQVQLQLFTKL